MKKLLLAASLAVFPMTALSAQNMPLNQFLVRATALEKKGPLALLSSDMNLLKKEITESAKALRAERLAARAAGKKPAYCPPEKSGGVGVEEILGHLRSIPEPQRARMSSKDGFKSLLVRKYPCRG
ncbi:MAG: hypothetical protein H0W74_12985 [Sphingosinicella sp.]|nr:hypothetical protein [Sphingosinicella sp.]